MHECLNQTGHLLLSGFLISDGKEIVEASIERQLKLVKQTEKENWVSLLFVNGK